jgi:hypothetical protein
MNGEDGREQLLRQPGAARKISIALAKRGHFHRSIEQSKAGQD